jgi:hypothetical protein
MSPTACAPRWIKLRPKHPDVTVTEAFNFVDPVVENYKGSMTLLLEGAVLAVIVVWLFLRDWRATLVAATALPLSIIPAFAVMHYMLGFTLNVVTLLVMHVAGRGHPGGRRHRRDRKHHAPPAHGQDALCRPPWKRPTRSGWPSSPPPSR